MKHKIKKQITWLIVMLAVYGIIQTCITLGIIDSYYQLTVFAIGINIILALGLNLTIGVAGQFSLGHAGFMSIGAYTCAIIALAVPTFLGFILGCFAGIVLAGFFAYLIAIPTLRLKGDYLAIATLGFAEIVRIAMVNGGTLTNGSAGLSGIPTYVTWTMVFICIVFTLLLILNYGRSSAGRATIAIREDEVAAEAVGIHTLKYKTMAFVIGAMTAGLAGALVPSINGGIIRPSDFGFNRSIDILIVAVFGGLGSMTGTIIAAIFLGIVNMFLQDYAAIRMIIYGALLVIIMIFRPTGLFGTHEFTLDTAKQILSKHRQAHTKLEEQG